MANDAMSDGVDASKSELRQLQVVLAERMMENRYVRKLRPQEWRGRDMRCRAAEKLDITTEGGGTVIAAGRAHLGPVRRPEVVLHLAGIAAIWTADQRPSRTAS